MKKTDLFFALSLALMLSACNEFSVKQNGLTVKELKYSDGICTLYKKGEGSLVVDNSECEPFQIAETIKGKLGLSTCRPDSIRVNREFDHWDTYEGHSVLTGRYGRNGGYETRYNTIRHSSSDSEDIILQEDCFCYRVFTYQHEYEDISSRHSYLHTEGTETKEFVDPKECLALFSPEEQIRLKEILDSL